MFFRHSFFSHLWDDQHNMPLLPDWGVSIKFQLVRIRIKPDVGSSLSHYEGFAHNKILHVIPLSHSRQSRRFTHFIHINHNSDDTLNMMSFDLNGAFNTRENQSSIICDKASSTVNFLSLANNSRFIAHFIDLGVTWPYKPARPINCIVAASALCLCFSGCLFGGVSALYLEN